MSMWTGAAQAGSSSYTGGGATGNWNDPLNWLGGTIPGDTASLTNTDTATFNAAPTNAILTIVPDANRNLQNITFNGSAAAYIIGTTAGNQLKLTSGGSILYDAVALAVAQTINAPLEIEGTNGTYSFTNNNTSTGILSFGGTITGGAAGNTVLTLAGTSASTNSNIITGNIQNGSATALALNKTGVSRWVINNSTANTFTGGTTISAGVLAIQQAASLGGASGNNSNVTLSTGATLSLLNTASTVFFNNVGVTGAGTATINIDRGTSGASLTHTVGTVSIGTQTLTVSQSNFATNTSPSLVVSSLTLSGNPTLNIANASGTAVGVVRFDGLNDGGVARTITKSGSGTLAFGAAATSFTPSASGNFLTISAGNVRLDNSSALGTTAGNISAAGSTTLALNNGITINNKNLIISSTGNGGTGGFGNIGVLQAFGTGTSTWAGTITLPTGATRGVGGNGATLNVTGQITGTGTSDLLIRNDGSYAESTRTISGTGAVILNNNTNNYTGITNVVHGKVSIGVDNGIPTGNNLAIGFNATTVAGTFDLNDHTQAVAGLSFATTGVNVSYLPNGNLTNSSANFKDFTINGSANSNYGGLISGKLNLIVSKTGGATQSLGLNDAPGTTGAAGNTFTGSTTLNSGTLSLDFGLSGTGISPNNTNFADILPVASLLNLNGGTLQVKGRANGTAPAINGTTTSGSALVTGTNTTGLTVGQAVSGANIPANSFITGINGATSFSINANVGTGTTGALTVAATSGITSSQTINNLNISANSTVDVLANGGSGTTLTLGGGATGVSIIGSGNVTKTGDATLILKGNSATSTANTWTGGLVINNGPVQVGNAFALNTTTPNPVSFGASAPATAKLQLLGISTTIGGLATNATPGTPVVENGSTATANATLTLNPSSPRTYAGTIQDGGAFALSLAKTGLSNQTLSGVNAYTGTTAVNAGTLTINGSNTPAQDNYTIAANAILAGNGSASLAAGKSISVTGTLSPGDAGIGTFTADFAGSTPGSGVIFNANSTYAVETAAATKDLLNITGTGGNLDLQAASDTLALTSTSTGSFVVIQWSNLRVSSGVFDQVMLNGNVEPGSVTPTGTGHLFTATSGNLTVDYNDTTKQVTVNIAAVPEPGAISLIALGSLLLLRRRNR